MFLASTCNSTIIETYVDIIRVSHGFEYCQSLGFIAAIATGDQRTVDDDITNILRTLIIPTLLELCAGFAKDMKTPISGIASILRKTQKLANWYC